MHEVLSPPSQGKIGALASGRRKGLPSELLNTTGANVNAQFVVSVCAPGGRVGPGKAGSGGYWPTWGPKWPVRTVER